jgi:type IV pilus assembly protein PilW
MTRTPAKGMTLIELMVALALGLILSLAVFGIMTTFEGRRRTLGAGADLDQSGTLAMFQIDRWARSAGSGFAQAASYAFGCPIYAAKAGNKILPSAQLPDPFDGVNPGTSGVFRLAPVLILPGQTTPGVSGQVSDALW